jgi:hypothetical protein
MLGFWGGTVMPDDELSDLEFPTAQWLKRVRDARLSCEECAAKANQINQLAQQRQKLDAKVLSSDTEPAERDRSRRASQKIEAKIRRLMGPWNEIERRARALAQDLLDVAELALGQIRLQLLEAGEAEQECMEQRQEDGLRGDLRIVAGIAEATDGLAEGEDFIDVGGEGRQGVGGVAFHSIKCKIIQKPNSLLPSPL